MAAIDVTIEKLIYGGEGLAHHEGATVFVPFVLPKERVAVAPVEQKKKFVRAKVEKVLDPAPSRTAPRCPYFGVCGGCDYQHIPYEEQLTYKVEILRETLRRIGKINWQGEIRSYASPAWQYRNRVQWKVRPKRETDADGAEATGLEIGGRTKLDLGYFRANSTALCEVDDCFIISPLLLQTLKALREALSLGKLPRSLREIEAFADSSDTKLSLTFTFAGFPPKTEELAKDIRSLVPAAESVLFYDPGRERMELFGPGFIEYELGDTKYRVGHFSFFQVNRFITGDLVRDVVEHEESGRLALDLFAGVGLFSIPLAQKFERVVAVESNPAAIRDLETNLRGHGVIEARTADAERFLDRFRETPDLVVLDPPRAGVSADALKRLAQIAPQRITYVSCEPPTLARDLAALQARGYELCDLHLFDLFPQTFHMETVARLRRKQ